jgi:hypothetical protein
MIMLNSIEQLKKIIIRKYNLNNSTTFNQFKQLDQCKTFQQNEATSQ